MDLRNGMRQLMPVTLPLASPCLVSSTLWPLDRGDGQLSSVGMLMSISTAGAIQCSVLNNGVPDTIHATSLYAPLNSLSEDTAPFALGMGSKTAVRVTSVCLSPSSHFLSVGCSNGYVIQYCNNAPLASGWADTLQVSAQIQDSEHGQYTPPKTPSYPQLRMPHHHNAAGLSSGDSSDNAIVYSLKAPHSNPSVPPSYNPNYPGATPEVSYYDHEMEQYYDTSLLECMYAYTLPTVKEVSQDVVQVLHEDMGQRQWCIAQNNYIHNAHCEEKQAQSASETPDPASDPLYLSEFPLSSFTSTPSVTATFSASHMVRREVAREVLQQASLREFIDYARNPGYTQSNSLIQMQELAVARGRRKFGKDQSGVGNNTTSVLVGPHLPYQLLDPRFLPNEVRTYLFLCVVCRILCFMCLCMFLYYRELILRTKSVVAISRM